MPRATHSGNHALLAAALVSAALGLGLGARRASWQDAVEPSQVLAGRVVYPDTRNPFYLYQTRLATLVHPLGAAALRAGLDEVGLARLLSAVLGAVGFAAVGVWTFGLGGSLSLALALAPLLVWLDTTDWGVRYPLTLMGGNTYGVLGLDLVLLALGLVGGGRAFAGGLVAGLAPAFHAVLGSWCLVVLGSVLAWRSALVPRRGAVLRGAVCGLAATAVFYCVHLARAPAAPPVDPALAAAYRLLFNGDAWHQGPLNPGQPQVLLLLSVGALVASRLVTLDRARLPEAAPVLLRIGLAASALGLAVAGAHTVLGGHSPELLVLAMPCRLLNPAIVMAYLSLVGLLWAERSHWLGLLNLAALVASAAVNRLFEVPDAFLGLRAAVFSSLALLLTLAAREATSRRVLKAAALPLVLVLVAADEFGADPFVGRAAAVTLVGLVLLAAKPQRAPVAPAQLGPWPARGVLAGIVAAAAWGALEVARPEPHLFDDPSNDAVLEEASRGSGFLVAGSTLDGYVQRRTRRPMLIDTEQIDGVAYVPETGAAVERILRRVYGVQSFSLPVDEKALWEERAPGEWAAIRAELKVTNVLTDASWRLQLPTVARSDAFALYAIPTD